ncbi:MAG: Spy/CpxP family protein refolding chaperone [Proteobacteria bacterium]|nr:Spy/CpxP family protein refolding chaperone [Pseudomonadota bacterium]
MKKVTLTVMGLFFVAAIATSAFGFGWGRGPGVGYGPCARCDFQGPAGVDLTTDQKAKLDELHDAWFKDIKPLREKMFTRRDELRNLWLEKSPDQEKIAAAQKEMRAVRDQMQDKMTAYRLDALKILTPEQQEKIKSSASGRGFGKRRGFGLGAWGGKEGCSGGGPGFRGKR